MPVSKYGRELLLKITSAPPSLPWDKKKLKAAQIDVSGIPDDVLDDAVDEVGGFLTFHKTLRLNRAVLDGCKADEVQAAEKLLDQVKQGILDGKATLSRGAMGHVEMAQGIGSAASPLPMPKSTLGPYQVKVKSLKKWGITYGYRIWMNHALVQDLAKGGAAAATILAWLPVAGWILVIISAAVAVLKTFDSGNGVYFYVTFGGVWWVRSA